MIRKCQHEDTVNSDGQELTTKRGISFRQVWAQGACLTKKGSDTEKGDISTKERGMDSPNYRMRQRSLQRGTRRSVVKSDCCKCRVTEMTPVNQDGSNRRSPRSGMKMLVASSYRSSGQGGLMPGFCFYSGCKVQCPPGLPHFCH